MENKKKNLIIVINNMMTRYNLNEFVSKTYIPALGCLKGTDFNARLMIVDDSGDVTLGQITDYYGSIKGFNRDEDLLVNFQNKNLLASRYRIIDYLEFNERDLKNTWIRFIDAGDTPINSDKFQENLNRVIRSSTDWVIFPQYIDDTNDYYYSCLGDTNNSMKVITSTLMNLLSSTMWTKVFRADLLLKVRNEIMKYNKGKIPNLFHTEDYLTCSLYSKYVNELRSIKFPFIKYDTKSGESRSRKVSEIYYKKILDDLNVVYDTIDNAFLDSELINGEDVRLMTDFKLGPYMQRFSKE